MQTATVTAQQPPTNNEALRIEAYHLAKSVLPIFEGIFPDVLIPRMAIPIAMDVAEGRHNYHTMEVTREWLQGAIDDAHAATAEVGHEAVWDYHAACMAATTISLALAPVIDLDEVERCAKEALFHASSVSRRVH